MSTTQPETVTESQSLADEFETLVLEVIEGPDQGKRFPLKSGRNLVGREVDTDVRLESSEVSRHHAAITVDTDIQVEDLGSAMGTTLNGRLLMGKEFLFDNDEVLIGPYTLRVEAKRRENPRGILIGIGFLLLAGLVFVAAILYPQGTIAERVASEEAQRSRETRKTNWRNWETLMLPDAEILASEGIELTPDAALEQYDYATRLYQDRLGDPGNPYNALLGYKRTLAILQHIKDRSKRPAVSNRALERIISLREMIRDECETRVFTYQLNSNLEWWKESGKALQEVRQISPWPGCRYNSWARMQLNTLKRLGKI